MARFIVHLESGRTLTYDTADSSLRHPGGKKVDLSVVGKRYLPLTWPVRASLSHTSPAKKTRRVKRLKIQLGLGCNYSCSYCSQGPQRHREDASSTQDAAAFLGNLHWIDGEPEKIEFWGGEPLLYWNKIAILAPALRERFPNATFLIITNGSLLQEEIISRLDDWGFRVTISHDGPGQHRRGPDPFDEPDWVRCAHMLFARLGERAAFNAVLTPGNIDPLAIVRWFHERMGPVKVNVEDPVSAYEGMSGFNFSREELEEMTSIVESAILSADGLAVPSIANKLDTLVMSLAGGKALEGASQWCGMDQPDFLAVDLKGNAITCQNTGANGGHKIGHVDDFEHIRLDTVTGWEHRHGCRNCPVVHLCYGSCMFLQGHEFEVSCQNSFHYNLGILKATFAMLAGENVVGVDMEKPPARRFIRLVVDRPAEIQRGRHIVEWVADRFQRHRGFFGPSEGIAVVKNASILAAVVFNKFDGDNVHGHIYSDGKKSWATRRFLREIVHYPFVELGAKTITATADAVNADSINFLLHFGFRQSHPHETMPEKWVFVLRKEDCRWLAEGK